MNAYIENKPVRLVANPISGYKHVAIIDVDDVLAEFPPLFIDYIEKRTGKPLDFGESQYGLEDAVIHAYPNGQTLLDDFYRSRTLLKLPAIRGGLNFIRLMKSLGFHLVALTGRPGGQFQEVIKDTILWLNNNGFEFDEYCFSRMKGDFVKDNYPQTGGGWMTIGVEDNLKNAVDLSQHCNVVYHRKKPHSPFAKHPRVIPFWKFSDAADHLVNTVIN